MWHTMISFHKHFLRLVLTSLLVFFSSQLLATTQRGDILLVDGEKWNRRDFPIEKLERATLNILHSIIEDQNSYKLDDSTLVVHESTGCWRGYVAEWSIQNGRLILNQLYNVDREPFDYSILIEVIPEYFHDGFLYADWL